MGLIKNLVRGHSYPCVLYTQTLLLMLCTVNKPHPSTHELRPHPFAIQTSHHHHIHKLFLWTISLQDSFVQQAVLNKLTTNVRLPRIPQRTPLRKSWQAHPLTKLTTSMSRGFYKFRGRTETFRQAFTPIQTHANNGRASMCFSEAFSKVHLRLEYLCFYCIYDTDLFGVFKSP